MLWSVDPTPMRHVVTLLMRIGDVWFVDPTSGVVRWPALDTRRRRRTPESRGACITATDARLSSFDDPMRELPPGTAATAEPIARKLRAVILDDFPEAIEVVRLGDRAASFGAGPKKMSEAHVHVIPQAAYVNLGFYHGVGLPDPAGLLEGTGVRLRHVKVRLVEDVGSVAVRALVAAARTERRS